MSYNAPSPIAIFSCPSILLRSAVLPTAVLKSPWILLNSEALPTAVFLNPYKLFCNAPLPTAVLGPILARLEERALYPIATLSSPSTLEASAL